MVKQMKALVKDQGFLCTTIAKSGYGFSASDKQEVLNFFDNDDISREMPGSKDYASEMEKESSKTFSYDVSLGGVHDI